MLNQAESNGIKNYTIYSVLLGGKSGKLSFTWFYHPSRIKQFGVMDSKRENGDFNI
jgi:hypothetical protein